MKKLLILLLLLLINLLSGCLSLLTYREGYIINSMAFWEHKVTHDKVINEGMKECVAYAEKVNKEEYTEEYIISFQDTYGKCMYEKGYRFKTSSWLYCYHKKKSCEIYAKYEN